MVMVMIGLDFLGSIFNHQVDTLAKKMVSMERSASSLSRSCSFFASLSGSWKIDSIVRGQSTYDLISISIV